MGGSEGRKARGGRRQWRERGREGRWEEVSEERQG